MRRLNNLKAITNSIYRTIIIAFFVIIILFTIIWISFKYEEGIKEKEAGRQEVLSTVNLFKSNLSEKLSLIANSPIFIQYLNSGKLTREETYVPFLTRISELNSPMITGMEIKEKNGVALFEHGNKSNYHVKINLCYLNQELNNAYGNCNFTWKLYLDKKEILKTLQKLNSRITICNKKCQLINLLNGDQFGIFNIQHATDLKVGLKIEKSDSMFDFLFAIFIILLVILAIWIFIKTSRTIKLNLSGPLSDITNKLHAGKLPNNRNYIDELKYLVNQVKLFYDNKDKIEIARVAKQAAHDLRSPLIAMETVLSRVTNPAENELTIIKSATRQIHDIINNMLQKNVNKETVNINRLNNIMLVPILDYVISEKNIEIGSEENPVDFKINISEDVYKVFVKVIPAELKRLLSNICNNAIESLQNTNNPSLHLSVKSDNKYVIITVIDNGTGISPEKVQSVFKEGVSYKKGGNGLGLFHAKENIENWGGIISIESQLNNGTEVRITLPKQLPADWFTDKITLIKGSRLIIIDDSQSIHQQWKQYLNHLPLSDIELLSFTDPDKFIKWYLADGHKKNHDTFLVDYEFTGKKTTGLDIIKNILEKSNEQIQYFLVTSHSEYFDLHESCNNLLIKLIPKFLIPRLTISTIKKLGKIIVIESDPILIDAYKLRAEKQKKQVDFYDNLSELLSLLRLYPKNTTIYASEELANSVQKLQKAGYNKIFIISHNPDQYTNTGDIQYVSKELKF